MPLVPTHPRHLSRCDLTLRQNLPTSVVCQRIQDISAAATPSSTTRTTVRKSVPTHPRHLSRCDHDIQTTAEIMLASANASKTSQPLRRRDPLDIHREWLVVPTHPRHLSRCDAASKPKAAAKAMVPTHPRHLSRCDKETTWLPQRNKLVPTHPRHLSRCDNRDCKLKPQPRI